MVNCKGNEQESFRFQSTGQSFLESEGGVTLSLALALGHTTRTNSINLFCLLACLLALVNLVTNEARANCMFVRSFDSSVF